MEATTYYGIIIQCTFKLSKIIEKNYINLDPRLFFNVDILTIKV